MTTDAEFIFQMDADLSHDPKLPARSGRRRRGADIVIGSRYLQGVSVVNWPLRRLILSTFANWYVRTITGMHVRDCTAGFRCWRREAIAAPAARSHRVGRLLVPGRDAVPGARGRLHRRRGADHLRRAPRRRARRSPATSSASRSSRRGGWRCAALFGPRRAAPRALQSSGSVTMPAPPAVPSLSVFFPAYNDSGTIASLVIRALHVAASLTDDYEVIVVNDGSKDATGEILDELTRVYPEHFRVVHHAVNRGYGGALRSGFAAATKDLVFYTDGDAQYDPGELTLLWQAMRPDVDWVNGWKISRSDPLHRIIIGRIYHHTVKLLFGLEGARRRLRLPADAAADVRGRAAREEQRRHLPGDDEEVQGRRLPRRRSAGAPLPPRPRQVAVLQLSAHRPHRRRRAEAVVGAGGAPRAPARAPRAPAPAKSGRGRDRATSIAAAG